MKLTDGAIAELKALEDRRGRLTAEQVVEAAEDESSALHACFEWDDVKAGAAYRIEQARELIRRVKIEVTIEERTFKTVAYVRDPEKEGNAPGYQNLMRVTARTAGDMMRNELTAVSFDLGRVIGLAEVKAVELPGVAEKVTTIKTQVDRLAAEM